MDASVIRQNGKQQHQQRIHLCYSRNENRMKQVKVSDQHTAESLAHFSMKKGDVVLADAGYGTAQNFIYAQEQGADVILRICVTGTPHISNDQNTGNYTSFLLLIHSGTLTQGRVKSTIRVCHLSSVKALWKRCHRHTHLCLLGDFTAC